MFDQSSALYVHCIGVFARPKSIRVARFACNLLDRVIILPLTLIAPYW